MRDAIRVDGIEADESREAGEERTDVVGEDEVEWMVDVDVAGVGRGVVMFRNSVWLLVRLR